MRSDASRSRRRPTDLPDEAEKRHENHELQSSRRRTVRSSSARSTWTTRAPTRSSFAWSRPASARHSPPGLRDPLAHPRPRGSGGVEKVGDQVRSVRPGDPVITSYQSCGHCDYCISGNGASCVHDFELCFGGVRLAGPTPSTTGATGRARWPSRPIRGHGTGAAPRSVVQTRWTGAGRAARVWWRAICAGYQWPAQRWGLKKRSS